MPEPTGGAEDVRKAVQELIMGVLDRKKVKVRLEDIQEGVSLSKDLGIDSLDVLQISAVVEKKYGIKFPEEELKSLDDLGAILRAVERRRPRAA